MRLKSHNVVSEQISKKVINQVKMNLGNIYFLETFLCKYNLCAVVIRSHGIGALRPVEGVILRVEDFLQHGRPAVKSHPFEGRKGLRARQHYFCVIVIIHV